MDVLRELRRQEAHFSQQLATLRAAIAILSKGGKAPKTQKRRASRTENPSPPRKVRRAHFLSYLATMMAEKLELVESAGVA